MLKQVFKLIPLLLFTSCAQEDEPIKERDKICSAMGCLSIIRINFATARTQDFRVTIEKPGMPTTGGECKYNAARARFEPVDNSNPRAAACSASQIVVYAQSFDRESTATLEVFDALNVSLEHRQYSLV
jgi:hypothetical protein